MDKGAHFHCCDLQVHSPRDLYWTGDCPTTLAARRTYSRELVAACRGKGLEAIAISDHHDVAFIPFVRAAAEDERDASGQLLPPEQRLVVFPAIELTLGVPHQALAVFDPDIGDDALNTALTMLGIAPTPQDDPKIASIQRLPAELNLNAIQKLYNSHASLIGRFILLPNVGTSGDSIVRTNFADHYISMHCVGGYIEGDYSSRCNRNIVEGRDPQWGSKAVGVIQTSDSRERDFSKLGTHPTWIKWSVPSAEAIRQAVLAPQSRIRHSQPTSAENWIRRLEVSQSQFFGPFSVEFNPQSNMIIGGRGSGKSTILEYLRWALADQAQGATDDGSELPDYVRRRQSLVSSTLGRCHGTVTVEYVKSGVPHYVSRDADSGRLSLRIGDGRAADEAPVTLIQSIASIQGYSQKQLSHVSVRTSELVRLLTAPIQQDLALITSRIESLAGRLRHAFADSDSKRGLEDQARIVSTDIESKRARLDSLKADLGDLPPDVRADLDAHEGFQKGAAALFQLGNVLSDSGGLLQATRIAIDQQLQSLPAVDGALPAEELTELRGSVSKTLADTVTELASIESHLEQAAASTAALRTQIASAHAEHETRYTSATSEKDSQTARITLLRSLTGELEAAERQSQDLASQIQALKDVDTELANAREAWVAALVEETELLEKQARTLSAASGGQLRVTIQRRADVAVVRKAVEEAVRGAGLTVPERWTRLFDSLSGSADVLGGWLAICWELASLARAGASFSSGGGLPSTPLLTASTFIPTELKRIAIKITPAGAFELSLLAPKDVPKFDYRSDSGTYIPFENASPGQQATSLIGLLMNLTGGPLVVDQPEDDLDNATISRVAETLWEAKRSRQLIFVSHNPNLVVIGDAELVVHCDYQDPGRSSAVHIAHQGAIDTPEVNRVIADVMEGGERAFSLRKQKYGF